MQGSQITVSQGWVTTTFVVQQPEGTGVIPYLHISLAWRRHAHPSRVKRIKNEKPSKNNRFMIPSPLIGPTIGRIQTSMDHELVLGELL